MSKKRIKNGKKVDTIQVWTDGGFIDIDIYLARNAYGVTFVAVCDPFDVQIEGANINDITNQSRDLVKERSTIKWERVIHVASSGYELPMTKDSVSEFKCEIVVSAVFLEIATQAEKKIHRRQQRHAGEPTAIRDGWPKEHVSAHRVEAMIRDTEENRAALAAISATFATARANLQKLLSPESIAGAFARFASAEAPALLGAGQDSHGKEDDHGA